MALSPDSCVSILSCHGGYPPMAAPLFLPFAIHLSTFVTCVHMCASAGPGVGRISGTVGGGRVATRVCLCVARHWSVPPYRTNTRTSATPLTVTQLTFQVPSLRLQNTLSHTHPHTHTVYHHGREPWLWHWDRHAPELKKRINESVPTEQRWLKHEACRSVLLPLNLRMCNEGVKEC